MPSVQNLNTDLVITNKVNPAADITLATRTVFIDGNLTVGGNTTTVTKVEMEVSDNIITLNKGGGGASGVVLGVSGIEVDRKNSSGTGLANVAIRWNEAFDKWQITNDGTTYGNISSSSGVGATAVIDDPAPQLGGNLDVLNRTVFSSNTAYVKFANNVAITVTSVAPSSLAANTVVSAQSPDLGQSGLYTTTVTYGNNELITKSKAVWYSLIM
jgi:hypothetical protein